MCAATSTFAQQSDTAKAKPLHPVEVRSLRAGSNSPFVKTELNAADIEKANLGQDLPYLLQYTPSAVVTSDAGTGVGYTGLRVRGTDGIRMNVTMNGIPVNDAESQGAFFVDFPDIASSTSSIQLQRGVGTSTNGAGAFGATMSISNLQQAETASAEVSNSYGSFNTWKNTVHGGTGLLKGGFQFDARLSQITSDGYIDRSASNLKALQLIAGWKISKRTSLRFMVMTGKEKTGQGWNGVTGDSLKTNRTFNELGLKSNGSYYDNQTDNYQQDYYQLFFDHKFKKHLSAHVAGFMTRGKGYYEEYKMAASFSDYGLPNYVSPSGTDTVTTTDLIRQLWLDNYYYGSVFSLLYNKKNTELAFGGGITQYLGKHYGYITWAQLNVPDNYRWYLLHSQKNDLNLYVKAQQTIADKWILFGDLQYRHVDYLIEGFRNNQTLKPNPIYNFVNPKVGLTYLLKNTNKDKQKLYASFAVANKEPNRDDFEASPLSQPKAERLNDVEVGYELNKRKWSAAANLYNMMYKDQLVFTGKINDVGAYTRTNVPESYRRGIELQAGYMPTYWLKFNGNVTFSDNKVKEFTEYIDNYDDPNGNQLAIVHKNTPIALTPSTIAGGGITFTPFRYMKYEQVIALDIMGKFVSKQYLDNSGDENKTIKSYGLCDLRLRYSIQAKPFREVLVTLALNNIFNKMYESNGYVYYVYQLSGSKIIDNRYFPQAGFNCMAGLTLKF
ncbi:MAG: TonB-dependent receptor plug domain-containing protein [Bacteroidetes bacterium]|nr:TonB-dependent receptor plug domain-containing protein [Bacteroidota bacterium]